MATIKGVIDTAMAQFSGLRPTPKSCADLDAQVSPAAALSLDPTLPPGSFCMPAERLEPILRDADLEIIHTAKCASGVAGAQIVYLRFASEGLVLKAKWKAAKHGGTGLNNEPRKEVAAYLVQKWFLSPDEYVVPPTVCRAIPTAQYASSIVESKATFDDMACVFGCLAFWLDGTDEMPAFDVARFAADARYRDTVANLNLLTYVIDHRDTRPANFIFSKDAERPRALSIDNGLAFSGLINPRVVFVPEWRQLVVPKLPRAKIARLRGISRTVMDGLRVVAQLALTDGQLHSVDRGTTIMEKNEGVLRAGNVLQLGLTVAEIDGIEARVTQLLADVDAGKIELY